SHTTEVSGSTISYTDKVLPIKNVPILILSNDDDLLGKQELGDRIVDKLNWYYLEDGLSQIALAIKGLKSPNFMDIERYAAGFVSGLQPLIDKQMPLIIMVDADMAKALGHSLFAKLPKQYPFVCIDSVKVENGDYIDIGLPIANGTALPVIVKTLVFN
ncbi:MAG: ethanolamine ammonia-lyase reactivating factor EutA, partial [Pisciglobus halotolerans]|nr:ethanolamine ammonia-lyase reactivating factor EutA [Pisciglobus halotolerans]